MTGRADQISSRPDSIPKKAPAALLCEHCAQLCLSMSVQVVHYLPDGFPRL
jgi:hypothetical protein